MASTQASAGPTVPQLMTTVRRLSPAELREFKRRFADWQEQNGGQADEDVALVRACQARLSANDERRLKKLIAKSERATLSSRDLADYRLLVRRAERLDTTRLAALTQLARRWDKPVRAVMDTIGWEGGEDDNCSTPRPRP